MNKKLSKKGSKEELLSEDKLPVDKREVKSQEKKDRIEKIKEGILAGKYSSNDVLDDLAETISNTLFKNL